MPALGKKTGSDSAERKMETVRRRADGNRGRVTVRIRAAMTWGRRRDTVEVGKKSRRKEEGWEECRRRWSLVVARRTMLLGRRCGSVVTVVVAAGGRAAAPRAETCEAGEGEICVPVSRVC
ncbi:hypothetical protein ACLOJK_005922 [Asimina triloba]